MPFSSYTERTRAKRNCCNHWLAKIVAVNGCYIAACNLCSYPRTGTPEIDGKSVFVKRKEKKEGVA